MRLPVFIHRFHRWVGLLLGIQVLLWISGGLVMSAIHIDKVRGTDRSRAGETVALSTADPLLSPATVAGGLGLEIIEGARLTRRFEHVVYLLDTPDGVVMADAADGTRLSPLDADQARRLAIADYDGADPVAEVAMQTEPRGEIRGADLPLWRVTFADGRHTTLYVSPDTGNIVARRNRLWRIYDVFWMLHIMDYRTRDDFNHPLLVGSAAVAWFLTVSGLWLVVLWLRRRWR